MFAFLLRKWREGEISEVDVDYAVTQGWINMEEAMTIKNTTKNTEVVT